MKILNFLVVTFLSCYNYQTHAALSEQNETVVAEKQQLVDQLVGAAKSGNCDAIRKLIGKVDINARDKEGYIAFVYAACMGYKNIVKILSQAPGININAQDINGWTALLGAAANNEENIVKFLLQIPGIDVNAHDIDGCTPLIDAAQRGRDNIVKLLLEAPGIDINAQNKNSDTAYTIAIRGNKHATAKLIQDKIDELTVLAFEAICVPTSVAAERHNVIMTLKSIIAQIGVNIKDKTGETLLHRAIKLKNLEIVRLILSTDLSRLDMCDADGKDAIELAVGYPEVFELIMNLTDIRRSCANPTCLNISCTKRCSRCQQVFYCSRDCQKGHWSAHKHNCNPKKS